MIPQIIGAFFAELGFAMLFNIHGRKLMAATLAGTGGAFIYELSLLRCHQVMAMFLAACFITMISELLARRMKTPVTTFMICALIPLVPGGGMYYTMLEIISGNTMQAIETGLNTLACAGALALGIALCSALFSLVRKRA